MPDKEKVPVIVSVNCICVWDNKAGWILKQITPDIEALPTQDDKVAAANIYIELFATAIKQLNFKYHLMPRLERHMAGDAESEAK